jgi:hypothetical protein
VTLLGSTPHPDHLAAHAEIDLMLDTFPQNGGVTTLEALLMGVPVVTLLGERVPGRASASMLATLGLIDLVARTPEEYVAVAARLAGDLERLARERATLRERLLTSPIGDGEQYTRAVESAYRAMWRRWCNEPLTPRPPLPCAGEGESTRTVGGLPCEREGEPTRELRYGSPLPRKGDDVGARPREYRPADDIAADVRAAQRLGVGASPGKQA